jgi:hypothetical protein
MNSAQEFDKKGWAIIRGLVNAKQIELLRHQIESVGAGYDSSVGTDKLKKRTGLLMNKRSAAKIVNSVSEDPFVSELLERFEKPAIEHTKVLIKARRAPETPWHQDSGFWQDIDPQNTMFTVWVTLADVDKAGGCLRILDTENVAEKIHYPHKPAHGEQEREMEESTIHGLLYQYPVVDCPLNAGDALIFKSWVIHSAFSNQTDNERLAFKVVYQDLSKRPVPLSMRGVKLTGLTGMLNKINACMATRWNIKLRSLPYDLKSSIKLILGR